MRALSGTWGRSISGLVVGCSLGLAAHAQDAPLQVTVGDSNYLVSQDTVSRAKGSDPIDDITQRKAKFSARILDELILRSEQAREFFSAANRAVVFADEASGRLVEPWRKPLLNGAAGDPAVAAAKDRYREWATKLASDPRELVLAIARKDYVDGIDAYRDNAAIYRKVMVKGGILTYDEAQRFIQNQPVTARLSYARAVEEQADTAAAGSAAKGVAQPDPASALLFRQRLQAEIVGRIGSDIKSAADFDTSDAKLRRIAESSFAGIKAYRDAVKPATISFGAPAAKSSDAGGTVAQPGSITTTIPGQNKIVITVPAPPPKPTAPFDITGSILPLPANFRNPPPTAAAAPAAPAGAGQHQQAAANTAGGGAAPANNTTPATNANGGNGGTGGGAPNDSAVTRSDGASPGRTSADTGTNKQPVNYGDRENLKTYSSKHYHDSDGWTFNPMNGLWQNPADPSEVRIPSVITCCDDTGLSFPNEAVEAKADYWYDPGGVDPNCNRLYACGDTVKTTTPDPTPPPLTDRDDDILRMINLIEQQMPADEKEAAIGRFIISLPPKYQIRAHQLRGKGGGATTTQRTASRPGTYARRSHPYRESQVTGITSDYQPITKTAAQNIVGKYKSIPGGVTLEGDSPDLAFAKSAVYLAKANAFIINDDIIYPVAVKAADLTQIREALASEDKLGVSLGDQTIVFGALAPHGTVARNLQIADRFLGAITFNNRAFLAGYIMAPGYDTAPSALTSLAVYFNIHGVRFTEEGSGELRRSDARITATLVPLAVKGNAQGGFLPDDGRIERNDLPPPTVARVKHLQENIGYYGRERVVRTAVAYAETAAFLRSLKAKGIKPESK
jgi:hypothetical protein